MGALAFGLRTARLARIDPDAFWDLGFVAAAAAFLLSRLMLVAENPHIFLQYPLAVLELPAVSAGGLLLTALVVLWYVRRRGLPLLPVLDAAAPCAAVVHCFVTLGEFAGGTREGMPAGVPWAVGSSFGRVHPVELYAAAGWVAVFALLLALLRRRPVPGLVFAGLLVLWGILDVVTDFFHLPGSLYANDALDGIEWRGLELIVLGGLLLAWRVAQRERPQPRTEVHGAI